jgi:hypothetical protein
MSTSLTLEVLVFNLISRTKIGVSESVFEIRAMLSLHVLQNARCSVHLENDFYSKVSIKKGRPGKTVRGSRELLQRFQDHQLRNKLHLQLQNYRNCHPGCSFKNHRSRKKVFAQPQPYNLTTIIYLPTKNTYTTSRTLCIQ